MIDRSDAPAIAALVACPARSEWPAYFAGCIPPVNPGDSTLVQLPCSFAAPALAPWTALGPSYLTLPWFSDRGLRQARFAACSSVPEVFYITKDYLGDVLASFH